MRLGKAIFLLFALATLIMVVLLFFLGYISLPLQDVLGNGNRCYLKVRTDPSAVAAIPGEGSYERCTNVTLNAPEFIDISKGACYRFTYWDVDRVSRGMEENPISVHMNCDHTATAHYVTQYYLTMFTNFGRVTPSDGWYEAGSEVTINAFAPSTVPGERYSWNCWTGIGEDSYTGSDKEASVTMNSPINETASWIHQYYLTVVSPYGTFSGEGWYNCGETVHATLDTGTVDQGNSTRRVFISWTGNASGFDYAQSNSIIMDSSKIAMADWKKQYLLTVTADPGGTTNPSGSEWWDSESVVSAKAVPDMDYTLDHWKLDGAETGSNNPYIVLMNSSHALHAVFVYSPPPTYYLTVRTNPSGVVLIVGEGWYSESQNASLVAPATVNVSAGTRYIFDHWDVDGISKGSGVNQINVEMKGNHTATAHYTRQYYLTVKADPAGITTIPGAGWYDELTDVPLSALQVDSYGFAFWDVDGVIGNWEVNSTIVNMNKPHIATACYIFQPPVVGGTTVSLDGLTVKTWAALNALVLAALISVSIFLERKQRQN